MCVVIMWDWDVCVCVCYWPGHRVNLQGKSHHPPTPPPTLNVSVPMVTRSRPLPVSLPFPALPPKRMMYSIVHEWCHRWQANESLQFAKNGACFSTWFLAFGFAYLLHRVLFYPLGPYRLSFRSVICTTLMHTFSSTSFLFVAQLQLLLKLIALPVNPAVTCSISRILMRNTTSPAHTQTKVTVSNMNI